MAFLWDARRVERVPFDTAVTVELLGQVHLGWTLDLSEDGIGLHCPVALYSDQEVVICIARTVTLRAIVRHSAHYRHGCEFVSVTPEQKMAVRSLMQQAAALSR